MKDNGSYSYTHRLFSLAEYKWVLGLSLFLLLGICFPQYAIAQKTACEGGKPAVLYTGETYGYLRENDHTLNSGGEKSVRDAFVATYNHVSDSCPQAILVGMGDNFAPDYGARKDVSRLNPDKSSKYADGPWPGWIESNQAVLFFRSSLTTR